MSESSSYWYDSSPILGTAAQIVYGGADVYCKDVNGVDVLVACKGTRLSEMQLSILERICSLESSVDICSINIPSCFSSFFEPLYCTASDKTVIDFINFLLETACNQQNNLATKASKDEVNPFVTLEYCCCSPTCTSPGGDCCGTSVNVRLSEHIQNVLDCLCKYKEEVASTYATQQEVTTLHKSVSTLIGKVDVLESNQILMNRAIQCLIKDPSPCSGLVYTLK